MRSRLTRGAFVALLLAAAAVGLLRGDPAPDPDARRVNDLVTRLGGPRFADRQAAGKELVAVGEKALPALRTATGDGSPEVRRRAAIALRTILLSLRKTTVTGTEFVLVDGGEFGMGSLPGEPGRRTDEDQHKVRISRPFLLGVYEVTQAEYERLAKRNPSSFSAKGDGKDKVAGMDTARFPVEGVSWFDAVEFCNLLGEAEGYPAYYQLADVKREGGSITSATVTIKGGNGFRLPTEAEWEYACRAGSVGWFHYGGENNGKQANLRPGSATGYGEPPRWTGLGRTAKVGSYPASAWGLHDAHGNVAEWCQDWYDKGYYATSPAEDPPGPDKGTHRVVRGGSWIQGEWTCRSASRFFLTPDTRNNATGFRVARTP